jgi:hypothetical protein
MPSNELHIIIEDDTSPTGKGAKLHARTDPQGDLIFFIQNKNGSHSNQVRICGPGGGSQYEGLATKLAQAFKELPTA